MKVFTGVVTSAKMKNTVTVKIERLMPHPLYKKLIKLTKKFLCQDDIGVKEGDMVKIQETRPLSARKRFKVISVETSKTVGK